MSGIANESVLVSLSLFSLGGYENDKINHPPPGVGIFQLYGFTEWLDGNIFWRYCASKPTSLSCWRRVWPFWTLIDLESISNSAVTYWFEIVLRGDTVHHSTRNWTDMTNIRFRCDVLGVYPSSSIRFPFEMPK